MKKKKTVRDLISLHSAPASCETSESGYRNRGLQRPMFPSEVRQTVCGRLIYGRHGVGFTDEAGQTVLQGHARGRHHRKDSGSWPWCARRPPPWAAAPAAVEGVGPRDSSLWFMALRQHPAAPSAPGYRDHFSWLSAPVTGSSPFCSQWECEKTCSVNCRVKSREKMCQWLKSPLP